MNKWKYKLESQGRKLRELLDKDDTITTIVEIYNQMEVCLKSLLKMLVPRDLEEWKYDIESMIEDIQMACPDIEDSELIYNDEEAILNRYLKDFYDLCDSMRVWIGLGIHP